MSPSWSGLSSEGRASSSSLAQSKDSGLVLIERESGLCLGFLLSSEAAITPPTHPPHLHHSDFTITACPIALVPKAHPGFPGGSGQ